MKKILAVLAAATTLLVFTGGSAMAATTVSPNPVPVSSGQLSVNVSVGWTQPANKRIFITQCYENSSSPTFDYNVSCSNDSELPINPANVTSGTTSFPLFRGQEPTGDIKWGCFAPGDTAPAGITKYTTCYIRVTNDTESNLTDQQFTSFTFSELGAPVPETRYAIALPIVAAAVAAGALVLQRRRRHAAV